MILPPLDFSFWGTILSYLSYFPKYCRQCGFDIGFASIKIYREFSMGLGASIFLSGLFFAAGHSPMMSEMKPHTPNIPVNVPSTPNNPPIRRTNILDIMDRPTNRRQRRHGVALG